MSGSSLSALFQLFDDESARVRRQVLARLDQWRREELADFESAIAILSDERRRLLLRAILEYEHGELGRPYTTGTIVRHRQLGYRGVIVDANPRCLASQEWYEANSAPPDPNQPWYHIFVDQSTEITYAAHSSLSLDDLPKPVQHPSLPFYFRRFEKGRYERNDRPWPRFDI